MSHKNKGIPLYGICLEKATTDCIHDNILTEILRNHKAEVTDMILDEYDEKFHIACEKKLSYEEGLSMGMQRADAEKQRADTEKQRADTEKQRADTEKQRTQNAIVDKNIFLLHLKNFSNEAIAQKLNISVDRVRDTLKEVDSDITESAN